MIAYAASVGQKTDVLRKKVEELKNTLGLEDDVKEEEEQEEEEKEGIHSWSVEKVSEWVRSMNLLDVARTLKEADINGFVLTQLNRASLTELGLDETTQNILLNEVSKELGSGIETSSSPVARELWIPDT